MKKTKKTLIAGTLIVGCMLSSTLIGNAGTYNVYHSSSLTAHTGTDTIRTRSKASNRNNNIKGPKGTPYSQYKLKVTVTAKDCKTILSSSDTLTNRPDNNGNKLSATNLVKNSKGQPNVPARQRLTVTKINMSIDGAYDNN